MPQPALGPDKEDKELGLKRHLSAPPPLPEIDPGDSGWGADACFSEIIQEIKQMQVKVLDLSGERRPPPWELGGSIQQVTTAP